MTMRFRSVGKRKSDTTIYSCDLPKIRREKGDKGQSINIKRILNVKNAKAYLYVILWTMRCNSNYASYSGRDINDIFYLLWNSLLEN